MRFLKSVSFIFLCVVFLFSCSKDCATFKEGEERGPCYPDNTCNEGLVCLSRICVNPSKTGEEGGPCYMNNTCNPGLYCFEGICFSDSNSNDSKDEKEISSSFNKNPSIKNPGKISEQEEQDEEENNWRDSDDEEYDSDNEETDDVKEGEWIKNGSLYWSQRSPNTMSWKAAENFCASLGGSVPTISELRTLIKDCSSVQSGGLCGVTDTCLSSTTCYSSSCDGCSSSSDGKYSVFGDTGWLWSSSSDSLVPDQAWAIRFNNGSIYFYNKASVFNARCVKQ